MEKALPVWAINDLTNKNGKIQSLKRREIVDYCVTDVETVPDESVPDKLRPEPAYGNAKKPEAREKVLNEWKAGGEIKAMSLNPFLCQVVSAQAWSSKTGEFIELPQDDEGALIRSVGDLLDQHKLIVGKAIAGFDLPVLRTRAMILGVPFPDIPTPRYRRTPVYDIQDILINWDSSKLKGMNQDFIAKRLGVQGKTGKGSQVYEWWKAGEIDRIHEYCRDDVESERDTFLRMLPYYPV